MATSDKVPETYEDALDEATDGVENAIWAMRFAARKVGPGDVRYNYVQSVLGVLRKISDDIGRMPSGGGV